MVRRLYAAAAVLSLTALGACGGTVETGGPASGGASGTSGSSGSSAGRGGSGTGSGGSTAGSGGSTAGSAGTTAGVGGSSGGSGGTSTSAWDDCVTTCDSASALQCPNGGLDRTECLKTCAELGTHDASCDEAFAAVFACLANTSPPPMICDDSGRAMLLCGPCDAELAALSSICGNSVKCTF
jgi:hypothetical protein